MTPLHRLIPRSLLLAALLAFSGCNRNQQTINLIQGTWEVSSVIINGIAQPPASHKNTTFTFNACKLSEGDCDGALRDSALVLPFRYAIADKGKLLIVRFQISPTQVFTQNNAINSVSRLRFVFTTEESSRKTVTTLEKKNLSRKDVAAMPPPQKIC